MNVSQHSDVCSASKFFVVLVLIGSVLVASCGGSDGSAASGQAVAEEKMSATAQPVLQLDPNLMVQESGSAFAYPLPQLAGEADSAAQPTRSPYWLTEDGRILAPAHAVHDDIRKNGKGAWSHWDAAIYFSSSDGSDPRQNNRKYVLMK